MKAARVLQFGPPSVITNVDLPRPEPAAGQLLVRVKAAGVGNWDALVREGKLQQRVWLTAFARYCGALEPPHISERQALQAAGFDAVYYATQPRGASNAKAKRELGFRPRPLQWLVHTTRTTDG